MAQKKSSFIAHRGESYDAPENTLAAIRLAWERGVTSVEIDVHLTADKEVCVIHDNDTLRTTGKKLKVSKSKMLDIKALDAGALMGTSWKDEKIPTLSEVLEIVPAKGKLIIEIKSGRKTVPYLQNVIKHSGLKPEQIEIISFSLKTLSLAKKEMSEYRMLWLTPVLPLPAQYLAGRHPKAIIKKLKKHNLNGANLGDSKYLNRNFINKLKEAGFLVYVWTVNDCARASKLLQYGADSIATDRAGWMKDKAE